MWGITPLTCLPSQVNLFVICAGNELFYVALYLIKWVDTPLGQSYGFVPTLIAAFTWAELMAIVCLPVCALKNWINAVQLWKASKILVGVDLAERAKAREEALAAKTN